MDSFQLRTALADYEETRHPEVTMHLLETIRKHTIPNPQNPYPTARMPTELLYVKHFSRAARYLIDDTEEEKVDLTQFNWPTPKLSIDQLVFLYWFNQRGVDLIETKKYDQKELTERSIKVMYGHFFSDKADIAFHLAKKSEPQIDKLSWALLAYTDITKCINCSQKIDPKHVIYQYGRRGEIEMYLGENDTDKKRRIGWLEKAYNDHKEAKERTAKIDPEHSAHQLSFMGEIAKQIAELVEEVSLKTFWLEKAYRNYTECIEKTESFNPRHAAAVRGHRAGIIKRMADTLSDVTLKCTLLERCYEEYSSVVKISEKIEMQLSGYQYGFMAETAECIVSLVDNKLLKIEWLECAYNCLSKSEERTRTTDKKYSGYLLSYMADVALEIANIIEEYAFKKAWLEKAYNGRKESGQRLFEIDKEHEAFSLTISAGIARRIADIEINIDEKIMWLEIALNDNLNGAEKIKEFNAEHYAMTHLNVGIVAAALFELNREHLSTAITSYTIYANYFEENVNKENYKIYHRTIREIERLKEIQRDITLRKDNGDGRLRKEGYNRKDKLVYEAVYEDKEEEEFQRRQLERAKAGDIIRSRRNKTFRKLRKAGMIEK